MSDDSSGWGVGMNRALTGSEATRAANRRLRANHSEEFEQLVREERVARGLPPERNVNTNDRLRQELEELRRKVVELGGEA